MDVPLNNTLSKEERLYCRKDIDSLLAAGRFVSGGPIRFCYRTPNGAGMCRILVSVPKKNFKHAVKRNLLKRRIREAYRLQKHVLDDIEADILFVYTSKEILSSEEIRVLVGNFLTSLKERCTPHEA